MNKDQSRTWDNHWLSARDWSLAPGLLLKTQGTTWFCSDFTVCSKYGNRAFVKITLLDKLDQSGFFPVIKGALFNNFAFLKATIWYSNV